MVESLDWVEWIIDFMQTQKGQLSCNMYKSETTVNRALFDVMRARELISLYIKIVRIGNIIILFVYK